MLQKFNHEYFESCSFGWLTHFFEKRSLKNGCLGVHISKKISIRPTDFYLNSTRAAAKLKKKKKYEHVTFLSVKHGENKLQIRNLRQILSLWSI